MFTPSQFSLSLWQWKSNQDQPSDDLSDIFKVYAAIILPWFVICVTLFVSFGFGFLPPADKRIASDRKYNERLQITTCLPQVTDNFQVRDGLIHRPSLHSMITVDETNEVCDVRLF